MADVRLTPPCTAISILLAVALGGCANMAEFTTSLNKEWNQPSVEVTPKQTPSDPEAQKLRAEMKAKKLAGLSVEADCKTIIEIAPDVISGEAEVEGAELKLADCQYHTLDFASARKTYKAAYERTGDPVALKGLALTELRDGRVQSALDLFSRIEPGEMQSDWQLLNAIGYARDMTADYDEAQKAYARAAELSPDKGAAFNNLGMSYLRQARYADAVGAFRKALDREPTLEVARLNLRIALAASGEFAVALAGASEAEQASILNSVGTQALAQGNFDAAKYMFQQALDKNPSFYAGAYENLERTRILSSQPALSSPSSVSGQSPPAPSRKPN